MRKYYKTPIETFIIHNQLYEEIKEHLRFRITLEATLLNRQSQEEVTKFNNLLHEYYDLLNPSNLKVRKDFTKKAEELLKKIGKTRYKAKKPVDITRKVKSPLSLKSTFSKQDK